MNQLKVKAMLIVFVALGLTVVGCQNEADGGDVSEKPKIAFDGKPDARFAGKWISADKKSHYDLKADGTYVLDGTVTTPGGEIKNKVSAKWCVKDTDLLFTDASGNVTPYLYKLEGNALTLTTKGSLKMNTELKREN